MNLRRLHCARTLFVKACIQRRAENAGRKALLLAASLHNGWELRKVAAKDDTLIVESTEMAQCRSKQRMEYELIRDPRKYYRTCTQTVADTWCWADEAIRQTYLSTERSVAVSRRAKRPVDGRQY